MAQGVESHGDLHQLFVRISDAMASSFSTLRLSKRDPQLPQIAKLGHQVAPTWRGEKLAQRHDPRELAVREAEAGDVSIHTVIFITCKLHPLHSRM